MLNNVNTSVERIIAKIDNDFNPDGSDWIPRVAAWTIDAMSQLNVLQTVTKRRRLAVKNRLAHSACPISTKGLKIYDKNGCEINELKAGENSCTNGSPTGERQDKCGYYNEPTERIDPDEVIYPQCGCDASSRVSVVDTGYSGKDTYGSIAIQENNPERVMCHSVHEQTYTNPRRGCTDHNYVLTCDNIIELNFDTDYIEIVSKEVETIYSDYYHTELPVIPNNGIFIEAVGFYCMYKMLCRGMKHPVFNLAASQYGTNPYYMWEKMKKDAKAGIIIDAQEQAGDGDSKAWRSYFYNYTFPKQ